MHRIKRLMISSTFEITFMFLTAYISYVLSDTIELSGILSLFVCSILMSHYQWYSVSSQTRIASFSASNAASYISETSTFISIGLILFNHKDSMLSKNWSVSFLLLTVV